MSVLSAFRTIVLMISLFLLCGRSWSHPECELNLETAISIQKNNSSNAEIRRSYEGVVCLAKQGDSEAKHEVFLTFYRSYPLLEEKAEEAFMFLVEAARFGIVDAQYNLGYLYYEGELVEKDRGLAIKWLEQASENGSPDAAYLLGVHYTLLAKEEKKGKNFEKVDEYQKKSIRYLELASNSGHLDAIRHLGIKLLAIGKTTQDVDRAITLLEKVASQGDSEAMIHLGEVYEVMFENTGENEHKETYIKWFRQAAQKGNQLAIDKLNELKLPISENPG